MHGWTPTILDCTHFCVYWKPTRGKMGSLDTHWTASWLVTRLTTGASAHELQRGEADLDAQLRRQEKLGVWWKFLDEKYLGPNEYQGMWAGSSCFLAHNRR